VQVNIAIMRAFVKLRELLASHRSFARRLDEMEKKYDAQFRVVFDAIRQMMSPSAKPSRKIGFPGLELTREFRPLGSRKRGKGVRNV
jgi:hypothetical protein